MKLFVCQMVKKGRLMYIFCVLGGGRQGTAIAYDLLKFSNAKQVIIADVNIEQAKTSVDVNSKLLNTDLIIAHGVDVTDQNQMLELLKNVDVLISAVPYYLNTLVTDHAIKSSTSISNRSAKTSQSKASPPITYL